MYQGKHKAEHTLCAIRFSYGVPPDTIALSLPDSGSSAYARVGGGGGDSYTDLEKENPHECIFLRYLRCAIKASGQDLGENTVVA